MARLAWKWLQIGRDIMVILVPGRDLFWIDSILFYFEFWSHFLLLFNFILNFILFQIYFFFKFYFILNIFLQQVFFWNALLTYLLYVQVRDFYA